MQPGSSDINLERVEALKLAIRNGELKMDTGKNCRCADQRSAARLAE
ncbi:Negative regulator of flagellin synthesis FlgM [Escherichia coli ISC7]|nr:Negative regulator of flagellin synthesis FlgM [Escherichia coli ISC7]